MAHAQLLRDSAINGDIAINRDIALSRIAGLRSGEVIKKESRILTTRVTECDMLTSCLPERLTVVKIMLKDILSRLARSTVSP